MNLLREFDQAQTADVGPELHSFIEELFPICRSITGAGVRRTLSAIQKRLQLETVEIPTGTAVFDWTIPREWNIRDAYIKDPDGNRIVDFQRSNLHVMSYSVPIRATMPLSELKPHLFTIPDKPNWIPYRTSYYKENWGFCLSHDQMLALRDGDYEVLIDATLEDGPAAVLALPGLLSGATG